LRTAAILVWMLALSACPTAPKDDSRRAGGALSCTRDEDCSIGACGPCESGAVITQDSKMSECVVNPCPDKVAMCAPNRTCVVK
jgi:hypothetical protein